MRAWRETFQAMAMAVAFAEEGESDFALSLIEGKRPKAEDRQTDGKKRQDRRPRQQTFRV